MCADLHQFIFLIWWPFKPMSSSRPIKQDLLIFIEMLELWTEKKMLPKRW